jgi:hypothetical protein
MNDDDKFEMIRKETVIEGTNLTLVLRDCGNPRKNLRFRCALTKVSIKYTRIAVISVAKGQN